MPESSDPSIVSISQLGAANCIFQLGFLERESDPCVAMAEFIKVRGNGGVSCLLNSFSSGTGALQAAQVGRGNRQLRLPAGRSEVPERSSRRHQALHRGGPERIIVLALIRADRFLIRQRRCTRSSSGTTMSPTASSSLAFSSVRASVQPPSIT